MSYSIDWVIPKRVLYSRVWGIQTEDQIKQSDEDMTQFIEEGIPLIHLIMDAREMESMPTSLGNIQSSVSAITDPSYGWVVAVGTTNPVTKFMGLMIAKLFRLRFRRVANLQEAIEFLSGMDATLNWDHANLSLFPTDDVHNLSRNNG